MIKLPSGKRIFTLHELARAKSQENAMTYEEYRAEVVMDVFNQMVAEGWSVSDCEACVMDVRREFEAGRPVRNAANRVLREAATAE